MLKNTKICREKCARSKEIALDNLAKVEKSLTLGLFRTLHFRLVEKFAF